MALVNGVRIPIRLISSNPTGYVLRIDVYAEQRDASNMVPTLTSVTGKEETMNHTPCRCAIFVIAHSMLLCMSVHCSLVEFCRWFSSVANI